MTELRQLGPLERGYDLWNRTHPHFFVVVAEFEGDVDAPHVAEALRAVQTRHPLLRSVVRDTGADLARDAPVFVTVPDVIALDVVDDGSSWQEVVGRELTLPFQHDDGLLWRAALVPGGDGRAVLVLTFQHALADGLSAVEVLRSVVRSLAGQALPPLDVPPSAETVLADVRRADPDATPPEPDPLLDGPIGLRPFDGAAPTVTSLAWSEEDTGRLLRRSRAEGVTVTAALLAAAARVVLGDGGGAEGRAEDGSTVDRVRFNVPISLRSVADTGGGVALHIGGVRLVVTASAGDMWVEARRLSGELRDAATSEALTAASDALAAGVEAAGSAEEILTAIEAANAFEVTLSNLGVLDQADGDEAAPTRLTAVWGPLLLAQVEGERMLGIATTGGRLRVTDVSHHPVPDFLIRMRTLLLDGS